MDLVANQFDIEVRYPTTNRPSKHISDFFTSNYYTGIVENETGSHVLCYFEIQNNSNISVSAAVAGQPLIFAQISIKNENENSVYYVEPLLNTNKSEIEAGKPLKYIVYRSEDILSDVVSNGVFK